MNAIETAIHVLQDKRLEIGLEMKTIDDAAPTSFKRKETQ